MDVAMEQESELHMCRVGLRWVVLWDLTRKTVNMSSTRRPSPTLKVGLQCLYTTLLYSGYFSGGGGGGGEIFMVFVVERRTTKFLPTKQCHIVWHSHTYYTATMKLFPQTGPKFTAHENLTP